jgi:arylsulfatase A-like enzyme
MSFHRRSLLFAINVVAVLIARCVVAADAPPNVVILLSDDQAWTDYGFIGHPHIQTPHLDKLAAQSLVFTRGYTPTSLCRASLMTIITGQYPRQHLVTGNDPPKGTDRGEMLRHVRRAKTLPKLLGEKGYVSFQSGKWWEGNFAEGGFSAGMTHGDPTRGGRHGDLGLKIGREGLQPIYDFLETNRGKPFFLWYAPMLPHQPHNPPERLLAKYRGKTDSEHVAKYWAMCEWWDETCGDLLGHLDKQGLAENTIVIYVTDNGWIQDPAAAKFAPRSKRSPYEGGIRTPIMVRWPKRLQPKRDEKTLVSTIDLAPTILAACGVAPAKEMRGISLLDSGVAVANRNAVHGEIYEHDVVDLDQARPGLLFRWCIAGDWKLIESRNGETREVYNLADDPREVRDMARMGDQRVQEFRILIADHWVPDKGSREKTRLAFAQIGTPARAIARAKGLTIYEGLPHQRWEMDLLDKELMTKQTVELDGFPFYQERRLLEQDDAAALARSLSDLKSFEVWSGGKFCGGYHPDYCLEWRDGEDVFRAQVCLGCHEITFFGEGLEIYCDINEDAFKKLAPVLKKYQKNRPMAKQ